MRSLLTGPSCILSTALIVLLLFVPLPAQDKNWRAVPPEDIAAGAPVVEQDADAEALLWEMRIDDSSRDDLDMWHYVRVKIFTERGREKFSKFDIPFTKGTKIRNLSARVIKADGTIVEVAEKDIFEREIIRASGVKVKAKSFAVPNIEPGVIVEYRYKEAIDDAGASGMRLPLQRDIPVRHMAYYYKPNSKEPEYQAYNTKDFTFVKDEKGFFLGERRNVPAFKEEPRMPPEDQVRPWLFLTSTRVQLTAASMSGLTFVIKDPGDVRGYWGAVASERGRILDFILKPDKKVKAAAEEIVAGATTNEEKLRRLYEYSQKQIHNVYYDPKVTDEQREKMPGPKSIGDILQRKMAPAPAYVDYLFGAFAGALGFDVRLAYTGNRSQMFFNPNMTNERLIHFAGIAIGDNNNFKYFNPCDPFMPFGSLSWFEEDSYVLMVGKNNYLWAETPALTHDENNYKRTANFALAADGTLEGDVTVELGGQPAIVFRQSNYDETPDKQTEFISNGLKARISSAEVSAITVENIHDTSKPVVHRYKVKVPGYAQKTGRRLFLQPSFFEYGPSALFSSSTRKYDIFFNYAWSETDTINITLPEGFKLDNAENPLPFSDTNRIGSIVFDIKYDTEKHMLIVKRKFHFGARKNILFAASSYPALKNVFDMFHKTDSHTITLRQD
ncbi:MAG: DUF3857 domain-containing protein [Chloracidobacterium sp.]|nr:DUF3857 domain-containing protein [Chloracidobacterium sp.]